MRSLILFIILAPCVMHAFAEVQITEFCPDPYQYGDADEYLVLSGNSLLDNISVSDGEGDFRFPAGTILGGSLTVARSAIAFRQSQGRNPDWEWIDSSQDVPDVITNRQFRMANGHDDLTLYDQGKAVQHVAWPEDVRPREGQIHYLEKGSWDPRVLLIGQSRLSPAVFDNVSVTTFVSPDCSGSVFSESINNAKKTILVNMYEFSSPQMGDSLIAAKQRGVDVRVLMEGGPVGGITPAERSLIWNLTREGIPVTSMVSTASAHAPYRFDHAKYVVIDNSSLLVTSENFKNSGFPPPGKSGNRGWGVYLEDPALSRYFTNIFITDSGSRSVVPYSGVAGEPEPAPYESRIPEYSPAHFEGATVIPVIAPDTSFQITDLLDGAKSSIDIEQAYITNETPYSLNPYLAAAVNASRRGVQVRILLDSYWYNVEDPQDNDEMAALINHIAATEHIPLQAKCIDLSVSQVEKIHNKGVIVDEEKVLVSSINWNSNSPNFNREAGVIIDHPGAARYFREVFNDDWDPLTHRPSPRIDYSRVILVILIIAVLILVYLRRRGR